MDQNTGDNIIHSKFGLKKEDFSAKKGEKDRFSGIEPSAQKTPQI